MNDFPKIYTHTRKELKTPVSGWWRAGASISHLRVGLFAYIPISSPRQPGRLFEMQQGEVDRVHREYAIRVAVMFWTTAKHDWSRYTFVFLSLSPKTNKIYIHLYSRFYAYVYILCINIYEWVCVCIWKGWENEEWHKQVGDSLGGLPYEANTVPLLCFYIIHQSVLQYVRSLSFSPHTQMADTHVHTMTSITHIEKQKVLALRQQRPAHCWPRTWFISRLVHSSIYIALCKMYDTWRPASTWY